MENYSSYINYKQNNLFYSNYPLKTNFLTINSGFSIYQNFFQNKAQVK